MTGFGIFLMIVAMIALAWFFEWLMEDFVGVLFGIVVVPGLIVLLSLKCVSDWEDDPSTRIETEIYSMGVNTKGFVYGDFILGSGTINGTSYPSYRYYVKDETDNSYTLNEVYAKNFKIICTDTVKPKIVINATREHKLVKPGYKWLFDENSFWHNREKCELRYSGKIYIPKNSIIQSFRIEL